MLSLQSLSHTVAYADAEQLAFLKQTIIPMVAERGAKLVLMVDSPYLARPNGGNTCIPPNNIQRCIFTEQDIRNHKMQRWQNPHATLYDYIDRFNTLHEEYPDTVFVFNQLELWMANGRGSNLIPGTMTNGFMDWEHLVPEGALYLWPYLCAAFNEWGFF